VGACNCAAGLQQLVLPRLLLLLLLLWVLWEAWEVL
jgi:hypothetical protein